MSFQSDKSATSLCPSKRGSQACLGCGALNGNRANTCKTCHRTLHKRAKKKPRSTSTVDVSDMYSPTAPHPKSRCLYSVRVRERGPDYRTFVSRHTSSTEHMECHYEACRTAQDARMRSTFMISAGGTSTGFSGPSCKNIAAIEGGARNWRSRKGMHRAKQVSLAGIAFSTKCQISAVNPA